MKKRILLFSSCILFCAAIFMSNANGPAHISWQNRTGSYGGTANCSTGSCHTGGSYTNTFPDILLRTIPLLNDTLYYVPADTYFLNIDGFTDAPKWGFQISSSYNNGSYHPVGTFIAINGNTYDTVINGYQIVEQRNTLTVPIGGSTSMNMKWVAPATVTPDSIIFSCTINNVNGDGALSGDNSINFKKVIYRTGFNLSVPKLNADIQLQAYPNPVTDKLNISLTNAEKGDYSIRVFDIQGKMVATQTANVNGTYSTAIDASGWAKGMYHVQLSKAGASKTIGIAKL